MNEILQKASDLRKQGMTYQEIADRFNTEGIQTLSGRGVWDKRTIQRKLEQYEHELTVKQLQKEIDNMALQLQTYQHEIAERDALISELNMKLANSVPKNPNNFEGWTVAHSGGIYRMFKKFSGKTIGIYVGREFNPEIARKKIAAILIRIKPGVTLIPEKRGRKPKARQAISSLSESFEARLRTAFPSDKIGRSYRIDAVRSSFPDISRNDFNREMIRLAENKRIELLGGDHRQCNPDDLIQDGGITCVNFQWV